MERTDVSSKLVHFTKRTGPEDSKSAFSNLQSIVYNRCLRGTSRLIKGGYPCVCFSEAPLSLLPNGLRNRSDGGNYSPFGVMVDKTWLFARGGRPVIYEPDADYEALPPSHAWRHVKYEPTASDHPVDFTWEREWRIQLSELPFGPMLSFGPSDATIVVPTMAWWDRLVREFNERENHMVELYSEIMSAEEAQQNREDFPWRRLILGD